MQHLRDVFSYFQDCSSERRLFFSQCQEEIRRSNLLLLRWASVASLILLTFFCFITPFLIPHWRLSWHYLWYFPVGLVYFVFSCKGIDARRPPPRGANFACILFSMTLLGYLTGIDIFPWPNSASTFTPLFLVVIPVLFILPLRVIALLVVAGQISFALLAYLYKSPIIYPTDIFTSLASLAFSFFIAWIITALRVSDGNAKASYRRLSRIDSLTGILNKSACEEAIRNYLHIKPVSSPCALLIIDLDDFKLVNDRLGHQAGDQLLEATGQALSRLFRASDLFGRFGGDEFLVLLRGLPNQEVVAKKCEQIQSAVEGLSWNETRMKVSCSIGAAYSCGERPSFESLFRLADDALYEAKAFGKGRHVLHIHQKLPRSDKKYMLIADDTEVSRALLAALFEDEYQVIQAQDGIQAMSCLSQYGPQFSFLLLDLVMPGLDGYAVLDYLRGRPALHNLRVLVITADETCGEEVRRHGADGLLLKPIDPQEAHRQVQELSRPCYSRV